MVMKTFKENATKAISIIKAAIPKLAQSNWQQATSEATVSDMLMLYTGLRFVLH